MVAQANAPGQKGERLFSSVDAKFKHTPGSVFGSAALVAGTTVGAGILAVPFVTADSGFVAASGAMTGTHFDLSEVAVASAHSHDKGRHSACHTLRKYDIVV